MPSPEERRLVTAVFCDLAGFTPLSERLDPEEVRDIQAAYFGAMSQQIERYGGIVEKYAGDAVLALFGIPLAHEDDPKRAVLCALGMQQAMTPVANVVRERYGVEIVIRVGVNTGEVVSGSWAAWGQQQAAVTGDAVNVAARIQAVAEPGSVLVGAETRHLTRRRIAYGSEQLLTLKGKREPVSAYPALGTRDQVGERWEETPLVSPLVGREREMAALLANWERVLGGEGQLVTVVGEPGVGKSRLVAEALDRILGQVDATRASGIRVLRGRCLSYGQSISLWLIADLLRSLCSLREDAGLEAVRDWIAVTMEEVLAACDEQDRAIARDVLGEVLGCAPGESLVAHAGAQIRRQSLVRILGLLLDALSQQPLVLVLEDVHWLDAASQEILAELLLAVPGRRMLVLAAQRSGGYSAPGSDAAPWSQWGWTEQITLRPLPDDEAAILAGAVLGGMQPTDELEEHLRARAGGNPFFLEELLRFLEESGGLESRDGQMGLVPGRADKLPSTLTEVLLARLDRLESQVKAVAQVGSVIGRSFAVRLLSRVVEREEVVLDGPLRALQQAEIAFPRGGLDREYVFKHVTLRDAAYRMLLRKRQRQLHLAVARAMAALYPSDDYVEMIAYHYARTEEDEEAAEWLERAGDRARDTFALEAAIQHYRDTCARLERVGAAAATLADVEEKLGRMLNQVARYQDAKEVLEVAIERYPADELQGRGGATAELAFTFLQLGDQEEARKRVESMLRRLAAKGPTVAATRLQHLLSDTFQNQGRYGEMLALATRMGKAARDLGDERMQGRAQERQGSALLLLGRIEEGRMALEEAIQLHEKAGDLLGLGIAVANLGDNRRSAGDPIAALRLSRRALELVIRTGRVRNEMFYHLNIAQLLMTTGEWAQAREHLARAGDIADARGTAAWVAPIFPCGSGELALREGNWEEAHELLEHAVELATSTNRELLDLARAFLAELAILERRAKTAQSQLQELAEDEGANLPFILPILAWAHLELGDTQRGLELVVRAEQETRNRHMLLYLPETLRIKGKALARLQRPKDARSAFTEGLVVLQG